MSNQGIRGFYQLTETIKEQLLADTNINTVSTGDVSNLNLNKTRYISFRSYHSK